MLLFAVGNRDRLRSSPMGPSSDDGWSAARFILHEMAELLGQPRRMHGSCAVSIVAADETRLNPDVGFSWRQSF